MCVEFVSNVGVKSVQTKISTLELRRPRYSYHALKLWCLTFAQGRSGV